MRLKVEMCGDRLEVLGNSHSNMAGSGFTGLLGLRQGFDVPRACYGASTRR